MKAAGAIWIAIGEYDDGSGWRRSELFVANTAEDALKAVLAKGEPAFDEQHYQFSDGTPLPPSPIIACVREHVIDTEGNHVGLDAVSPDGTLSRLGWLAPPAWIYPDPGPGRLLHVVPSRREGRGRRKDEKYFEAIQVEC